MPVRPYCVYILASRSRVLYVGVTSDLLRRIAQHRARIGSTFTSKYHVDRLVHFEECTDIRSAIAREKQIKGWSRMKKVDLIEAHNAGWIDLAEGWSL